jgi:hypothetical protein
VLADEPASSSHNLRSFNHLLGRSGVTFCAAPTLAPLLRKRFPKSLHGAPALMPTENTPMRRVLESWLRRHRIQPRVLGEFDDAALMKVMACEGAGFLAVPSVMADDAVARYGFEVIGATGQAQVEFYAITAERRLAHPGVVLIVERASEQIFKRRPGARLATSAGICSIAKSAWMRKASSGLSIRVATQRSGTFYNRDSCAPKSATRSKPRRRKSHAATAMIKP